MMQNHEHEYQAGAFWRWWNAARRPGRIEEDFAWWSRTKDFGAGDERCIWTYVRAIALAEGVSVATDLALWEEISPAESVDNAESTGYRVP